MLFLLTDSPQKLKLEKVCGALIVFLYVSPSSPALQFHFKENAKILPINSTTQETITISRQNLLFLLETQKTTTSQQVTGGKTQNITLKIILELFLKVPPLKKLLEFQD